MIHLTRRERFSAAHRMFRSDWSDKENRKIFGSCSNPNWHGHNYDLYVTIQGELNDELGLVVNLRDLSRVIKEKIIDKIDHKNINLEVDFMKGIIASTENLAIHIWNELAPAVAELGVSLYCIKIVETENNYVEYFGDK